jgi:hypothetical protein
MVSDFTNRATWRTETAVTTLSTETEIITREVSATVGYACRPVGRALSGETASFQQATAAAIHFADEKSQSADSIWPEVPKPR